MTMETENNDQPRNDPRLKRYAEQAGDLYELLERNGPEDELSLKIAFASMGHILLAMHQTIHEFEVDPNSKYSSHKLYGVTLNIDQAQTMFATAQRSQQPLYKHGNLKATAFKIAETFRP